MNLETALNSLELLRIWGLPPHQQSCLIVMWENMPRLGEFMAEYPGFMPARIMTPDAPADIPEKIMLGDRGFAALSNLDDIGHVPQYEKVLAFPSCSLLTLLCRHILNERGINHLWLGGPPTFGIIKPVPDYFAKHETELQSVWELLATDADRDVYARAVKAILTGNAGYLPISSHAEYQHPLIRPQEGDILMDGGVSDMVNAQKQFCEAVGPSGQIHGFEPVAWMAESAAQTLADLPQYAIHAAGLSDKKGFAYFDSLRDSSHVSAEQSPGANRLRCDLVRIDDFVSENRLQRVDCIKLDIEGSELAALHGAADTIRKWRPKLIICLYHKPEDLFTIPLYVKSLVPAYELHMAHSSSNFTDTILYARAR